MGRNLVKVHDRLDSRPGKARRILSVEKADTVKPHMIPEASQFGIPCPEALESSEERFRLLVEAVKDYAIFMLDPQGCVRSWNLGAVRVKGYSAEEITGKHFSIFYPTEDIRTGKPDHLLKVAASEGRATDEGWRVCKGGSRFWGNVVITALRNGSRSLRGFAVITRDATELKRAEDSVRQLSGRLLKLQEEEWRRVARELHDSTLQTLAALSINLSTLKERINGACDQEISRFLSDAIALAGRVTEEVRDFSHLLHPPLLALAGLARAIRSYVSDFMRRTNIRVDLQLPPQMRRLSHDTATVIFRIVQESLANVRRHSGSPTAEVRLLPNATHIVLEVVDHGKGLPPAAHEQVYFSEPAALGIGIRGMWERVQQLGGRLEIGPANPGTIVRAILPLSDGRTHDQLRSPDSANDDFPAGVRR